MNQYTKNAVDYAFDNKLSDMQDNLEAAIKEKVLGALEAKKIEVAQNMFGVSEAWHDDDEDDDVARADRELARMKAKPIKAAKGVDPEKDLAKLAKKTKDTEEVDEALKGKQHKLDKNKNGKLDAHDFKLLRKESEELEEKLSVSDGVDTWISDFVHSDDPKFKGKSKKERIQMALGAFYSAKKGRTRNEEVEELEELSKKTLGSYIKKASHDNDSISMRDIGKAEKTLVHPGDATKSIRQREMGYRGYEDNPREYASHYKNVKRIAKNRTAGIDRAVDRLTEVEELEELSKKTLGSYVKKASASMSDIGKAEKTLVHPGDATQSDRNRELGYDSTGTTTTPKEYAKHYKNVKRIAKNRTAGIDRAVDRLSNED